MIKQNKIKYSMSMDRQILELNPGITRTFDFSETEMVDRSQGFSLGQKVITKRSAPGRQKQTGILIAIGTNVKDEDGNVFTAVVFAQDSKGCTDQIQKIFSNISGIELV